MHIHHFGDGTVLKFFWGIIDAWELATLNHHQYRDFLEILDDRHGSSSTLIISHFLKYQRRPAPIGVHFKPE